MDDEDFNLNYLFNWIAITLLDNTNFTNFNNYMYFILAPWSRDLKHSPLNSYYGMPGCLEANGTNFRSMYGVGANQTSLKIWIYTVL